MSYAEEREYSPGQKRVVVFQHLITHRCITAKEVERITGCSERQAYDILLDIEGVVCLHRVGKHWRYGCEDEDSLVYGR